MIQTLQPPRSVTLAASLAFFATASLGAAAEQDLAPTRRAARVTEEIRRLVEAEPTEGLDPRIDGDRITELPAAETAALVLLPTAPVHRIATARSDTNLSEATWNQANTTLDRGLAWLIANQSARGGWMEGERVEATDQPPREAAAAIAVTAMGLKAFAQADRPTPDARMARDRSLRFVRNEFETRGLDGLGEGGLGNYVTSAVTMGLAALGTDTQPGDAAMIAQTVDRLTSGQWDQAEGIRPEQDWFGGAGYGRHGRPDLSNTQMMLDALYDAGVSPDEPVVQRALVFLSRTQNLKATNPADWAQAGSNDGGFVYTPANGGESFGSATAGEGRYGETMPEGVTRSLRSYGSMTYAGFKSLLFAGLDAEDPRVEAAMNWIRSHWTFQENPGLGQQGVYYYLHAMARALRASGLDSITTPDGVKHDWRQELIEAIASRQTAGGFWINDIERWEESRPSLATVYATLALEEALKPVE